jgi:hypothetical protein
LVAAELERRWEHALRAVRQAEEESQVEEATVEPVTEDLRRQLDEVRPTLRRMWDEGSLSNVRKKELLRTVIDKVVLQRPVGDRCEIRIVWKGGDWTTISVDLPVVTYAEMGDSQELVAEVLRRARAGQPDWQIAAELTTVGYHAPLKQGLGVGSVRRIRMQHGILARKAEFLRSGVPGWLSLGQAVTRLGEHRAWAYYLIRRGRLVIQRDRETSLYLIPDNPRSLQRLKELLRSRRFSLTVEPRSS